jgi:hypothetical protein
MKAIKAITLGIVVIIVAALLGRYPESWVQNILLKLLSRSAPIRLQAHVTILEVALVFRAASSGLGAAVLYAFGWRILVGTTGVPDNLLLIGMFVVAAISSAGPFLYAVPGLALGQYLPILR